MSAAGSGPAPVARMGRDIEQIAVDVASQGDDIQLTRYDEQGWRGTFYASGLEHSPTSAMGTA